MSLAQHEASMHQDHLGERETAKPNGPAVDAFAPTSLQELNLRAGLQTRFDRKYLLPIELLDPLLDRLADQAQVLEIGDRRSFNYLSVYFDSPEFLCYRAAAQRRARRFKLRTRTYVDSNQCFLEVKTKSRQGETIKVRDSHSPRDYQHLTTVGKGYVQRVLSERELGQRTAPTRELLDRFEPSLGTAYVRTTFFLPRDESRVTIDTGLELELPTGQQTSLAGHAVVETKTTGRPSLIDQSLWALGHRPLKMSKYAVGLAALRPDLPAAKWNRTLRSHFNWEPVRPYPRKLS